MFRTLRSVTLGLTTAALLVAGCGGGDGGGDDVASMSDDDSGESAQSDQAATEEELLDWVECMRDNGAEVPDPTVDEDGNLVIEGPVTVTQEGPAGEEAEENESQGGSDGSGGEVARGPFEDAGNECGRPPEGAFGPPSEEDRQAMEDAALEFAQCMRDNGVPDFPDPDFSNQGPGGEPPERSEEDESGGGGEGQQVVLGPFGEIDMEDPEVAAAFEQCQDIMMEGRPGGGGGAVGAGPAPGGGGSDG
jgi:hypothetical protein